MNPTLLTLISVVIVLTLHFAWMELRYLRSLGLPPNISAHQNRQSARVVIDGITERSRLRNELVRLRDEKEHLIRGLSEQRVAHENSVKGIRLDLAAACEANRLMELKVKSLRIELAQAQAAKQRYVEEQLREAARRVPSPDEELANAYRLNNELITRAVTAEKLVEQWSQIAKVHASDIEKLKEELKKAAPVPDIKYELLVSHRGEMHFRTFVSLVTCLDAARAAFSDFDAGSYPDSIYQDGQAVFRIPITTSRADQLKELNAFAQAHGIIREKLDGPFIQT